MAKISALETYKSEMDGNDQTLYIAVSETGHFFATDDLELRPLDNNTHAIDFEATQWQPISNERHHQISEEMHCVFRKRVLEHEK